MCMCKLNYFDFLCNTSFIEHGPENGQNMWPKRVAGYTVYNTGRFIMYFRNKNNTTKTTTTIHTRQLQKYTQDNSTIHTRQPQQ